MVATTKRKFCRGCQRTKSVTQFYVLNKEKGWLRSKCIACVNQQNAKWSKANAEHHRTIRREHQRFKYRDQLDESRAKSSDDSVRHTLELKVECFEKLGGKCCHCGFDRDERALQIDHVHGGGNQERQQLKSTRALYRKVLADVAGLYQLLCANCNWIKRHENKEWVSKGRRTL